MRPSAALQTASFHVKAENDGDQTKPITLKATESAVSGSSVRYSDDLLAFDGGDDYVGVGAWSPGSQWTLAAWRAGACWTNCS